MVFLSTTTSMIKTSSLLSASNGPMITPLSSSCTTCTKKCKRNFKMHRRIWEMWAAKNMKRRAIKDNKEVWTYSWYSAQWACFSLTIQYLYTLLNSCILSICLWRLYPSYIWLSTSNMMVLTLWPWSCSWPFSILAISSSKVCCCALEQRLKIIVI